MPIWQNLKVGCTYVYHRNRMGRNGELCTLTVIARVMDSVAVKFSDGYEAVTSAKALRPVPAGYQPEQKLPFGKPSAP